MPKSATLSSAVETATKCFATASAVVVRRRSPSSSQALHSRALVSVSRVPKVLLETMNSVVAGSRPASVVGGVGRVDVADEPALQPVLAVRRQRLVGHHRAEVGAADADVDHRADPLAGDAGPRAASGPGRRRRRPARSTSCTSATTSWPSTSSGASGGQPQRGVQHGAVLGDVDVLAAEHRVAAAGRRRPRRPARAARPARRRRRRFLDRSTCRSAAVKVEPLDAPGVVGEPARRSGCEAVGELAEPCARPRSSWRRPGAVGHCAACLHLLLDRLDAARPRTSTNLSTPSCSGPRSRRRSRCRPPPSRSKTRLRRRRSTAGHRSPWTSPWSATASRVFSGIVLTVSATTRSLTYIVSG